MRFTLQVQIKIYSTRRVFDFTVCETKRLTLCRSFFIVKNNSILSTIFYHFHCTICGTFEKHSTNIVGENAKGNVFTA